MSANWKTVRVFISSTFRDMQAERDHLVRFVFPKLRQELLQRRIHLVDFDLRWGLTSEQDALSVCREVVDECRPRFLCMLGGRYGWVPPGKTRSITADEVHYGVLDRDLKSRGFAFFYFRDPTATHAMVEAAPGEFREPAGSHGADALAELKTAIVEAGLQPFIYRAQWDDQSRRLIGLKEFGDQVYADFQQSIDQEFGPATGEKPGEFTDENAAMEAFIEERVQRFVLGSRQPVWNELRQHAECTGGNGYLCLTGEAGSGKSALLGKFCQDYRDAHPQDLVIPHFVGVSPGSTDVRRTLRRLCHELVTGAELTAEIPEDPEKLRVAFPEILQQAAAQKRVLILLDAINQFDPNTQLGGWSWLPEELPANARIILSTLSGPALESLRQRSQSPRPVELQPLDAPDREAIIREFLHRYRKSLTDDQRAALLAKADAGTPLYLLVALEELRTLGTYEEITHRISQLPPDTRALFIWILKRLEDDDGFRDASGRKIGRELVYRFVSLLGASRHGLSQQELVELLAPSDPQGNVAALAQLLRPYLMRRGELLDFYHGQFREAANLACLPNEASRQLAHGQLANFFRQQLDPDGQRTWTGTCSRSLSELPHHLIFAARWDELERTLCDPGFLYAKCVHCSLYDVLRDLLTSQEFVPQNEPAYSSLGGVLPVLDRHSHLIQENPPLIFQQMFNELVSFWDEDSTLGSILRARERGYAQAWLKERRRPARQKTALKRMLPGHRWDVMALQYSLDGTILVSGGERDEINIWDARTGQLVCPVRARAPVALHPEGKVFFCAGLDGFVELRDIKSGALTRRFQGCPCGLSLDSSPDGRLFASGGPKGVSVWESQTGALIHNLTGQIGDIPSLKFSPDGSLLACVGGGYGGPEVVIWDTQTGQERFRLHGHTDLVFSVVFAPDGKHVASGSRDLTLRIWDLRNGETRVIMTGHKDAIFSVAFACAGDLIASGSRDGSVGLFDAATGDIKSLYPSHMYGVRTVAFAPRGDVLAAGGMYADSTIRIWNVRDLLEPGGVPLSPPDTLPPVASAAFAPDGQTLAIVRTNHSDVELLNINTGSGTRLPGKKDGAVRCFALSPDGRWLITDGFGKALPLPGFTDGSPSPEFLPPGYVGGPLVSFALSPDGSTFAIGTENPRHIGGLFLVNSRTGNILATLFRDARAVTATAFSPDGRLVAAGVGNKVQVWDAARRTRCHILHGHMHEVVSLSFSQSGRILASASADRTVRFWDANSGKLISLFPCDNRVLSVWCNNDSARVHVATAPDSGGKLGIYMLEFCHAGPS